ncbi:hypothetical protein N7E02_20865 [Aliirhizobium terrae]|uniref:hypothetical protein n=1 Tax=Terrirhizobium terrae TaxID=2926709 RepID=UPI002578AC1F|nr:hypothetical protein [Rhizobium sp. CC-CFT758]WJH39288.1 hypothetical protein N7E02_20865 [Rhizobium sp. CC-CFT758]
MSITIYAAWSLSVKTEQDRLMEIAQQAVARTERSILHAAATLRAIDGNASFPLVRMRMSARCVD